MARINIEDYWWTDPRRDLLRRKLGAETQDQVALQAWRLAQSFWFQGKLIPWDLFETLDGSTALMQSRLAELRESEDPSSPIIPWPLATGVPENAFVYVKGSREYFACLKGGKSCD